MCGGMAKMFERTTAWRPSCRSQAGNGNFRYCILDADATILRLLPRAFVRTGTVIEERKVGNTMPRWIVRCPRCHAAVPHSEVTFARAIEDALAGLGRKPDCPNGGFSLECPNCKETAHYQRHQLVYLAN